MKRHFIFVAIIAAYMGFFISLLVGLLVGGFTSLKDPYANSMAAEDAFYMAGLVSVSVVTCLSAFVLETISFVKDVKGIKTMSKRSMLFLIIGFCLITLGLIAELIWIIIDCLVYKNFDDGIKEGARIMIYAIIAMALIPLGSTICLIVMRKKAA